MAEARDPLTPAAQQDAAGAYDALGKDPGEIERDIRETRAEMSETLDAIGARFQPEYLKEQAKDALRSTARDAGTTMIDTIKENPVPTLIAALSIGWLFARGGHPDRDRYGRADARYGRYPDYRRYQPYGYGRYDTGYGEQGEHALRDRASEAAGQAREKAGDLAHEARERAGDLTHQAADQIQELSHDVQRYGRRTTNWLEHQMDTNPLAVGAVALAAGALVGLAVPSTHQEDELLGRTSDRLTERVKDVAEEKLDQAKAVARETADEAKEKAREVVDTAKEEARHQGLASSEGSASSGDTGARTKKSGSAAGTRAGAR